MISKGALFLHGIDDDPQQQLEGEKGVHTNFYHWLARELEELGFHSEIPTLPSGMNQTREKWLAAVQPYFEQLQTDDIVIGRSMGATLGLIAAQKFNFKTQAICCVAGWVNATDLRCNYSGLADIQSFGNARFDWDTIRAKYTRRLVVFSDDDDIVNPADSNAIATGLQVEPLDLSDKGYGHFKCSQCVELRDALFALIQ